MTHWNPESLFYENGGRSLLEAHGIGVGQSPLSDYFSSNIPMITKPDAAADAPVRLGRAAPMGAPAVLVAWPGGIKLYCSAASPKALPGVTMVRSVHTSRFPLIAHEVMHLPRPLLFLTIGNSYPRDVADARLTLDPGMVESFGTERFTLSGHEVESIIQASDATGIDIDKIRRHVMDLEKAIAFPAENDLGSDKVRKTVLSVLGINAKDATDGVFTDFWRMVDGLPLSTSAAWKVAKETLASTELEQEAA